MPSRTPIYSPRAKLLELEADRKAAPDEVRRLFYDAIAESPDATAYVAVPLAPIRGVTGEVVHTVAKEYEAAGWQVTCEAKQRFPSPALKFKLRIPDDLPTEKKAPEPSKPKRRRKNKASKKSEG